MLFTLVLAPLTSLLVFLDLIDQQVMLYLWWVLTVPWVVYAKESIFILLSNSILTIPWVVYAKESIFILLSNSILTIPWVVYAKESIFILLSNLIPIVKFIKV